MKKFLVLALSSSVLLSGCASSFFKSDDKPQAIYSLRASPAIEPLQARKKTTTKILEIQRPVMPPGFDTARMGMYLEGGRRLEYYANARWASPLDEVIQEFTLQTARKTMPDSIAALPGQSLAADYRLQMKVNDFQPVYAGGPSDAPRLNASFSFTLLSMKDGRIVTSFTIEQQEPAQANTLGAVTAGLERLLQAVETKAFATLAPYIQP